MRLTVCKAPSVPQFVTYTLHNTVYKCEQNIDLDIVLQQLLD